jgi:hypothetical protein
MHASHETSPATAPSPLAAVDRTLRFLSWFVFALIVLLLLVLAGLSTFLSGKITDVLVALAGASILVFALRRLPLKGWARIGLAYVPLAPVLIYLATDDAAIRRPLTMEEFSPAFSGAEKSYAVLMRYGRQHPAGRDFKFRSSPQVSQALRGWSAKDPGWKNALLDHRSELESAWAELAPVRSWWAELNGFESIGDLTPERWDAEIMGFQPVREFAHHACAIASLQALDGDGEAAFATLLPLLEVSRKLEPSSRTLVRFMIARVVQRMALETAAFVLDTTSVSPVTRERFAAALTGGTAGEDGARRLVTIEYAWATSVTLQPDSLVHAAGEIREKSLWLTPLVTPVSTFVFNSRRTINLYGDYTAELQDLAGHRETEKLGSYHKEFFEQRYWPHFKNLGGCFLLSEMTPAYQKVVEAY